MEKQRSIEYVAKLLNRRKKTLFCKYFAPADPRAVVFLAHGYGEHCLMYSPLARQLADEKYFVVMHDHVGHGQSEGTRALIDTFDKYVDDVFVHIDMIMVQFPTLPVYICGHSMGGAIAILAAMRRPNYFRGLILIAPAVKTDPKLTTPFKVNLAKNLRAILPKFPVATLDLSLLCSCPETVKIMKADPLRYQGYCKAAFGASLIEAMERIQENVNTFYVPFLLLQGEADKVCSPEGAQFFYVNTRSHDKTLKAYPRAYHSLLYEPLGVAEEVKNDIIKWLNSHVPPKNML